MQLGIINIFNYKAEIIPLRNYHLITLLILIFYIEKLNIKLCYVLHSVETPIFFLIV